MLKIFIGYDERQPISFQVLSHSIIKHTSIPVAIIPLINKTLPLKRKGLTPFTYTRFLVPYLCNYEGIGIFLDADMLVTYDINDLITSIDTSSNNAIWVKKFDGYKFEMASVMVFNNEKLKYMTPDYIEEQPALHTISFVDCDKIGSIPDEWNILVGYEDIPKNTKLYHFTQGVPVFNETYHSPYSELYKKYTIEAMSAMSWKTLMGESVHSVHIKDDIYMPRFMFNINQVAGTAYLKEEYREYFDKIVKSDIKRNELSPVMDFLEH